MYALRFVLQSRKLLRRVTRTPSSIVGTQIYRVRHQWLVRRDVRTRWWNSRQITITGRSPTWTKCRPRPRQRQRRSLRSRRIPTIVWDRSIQFRRSRPSISSWRTAATRSSSRIYLRCRPSACRNVPLSWFHCHSHRAATEETQFQKASSNGCLLEAVCNNNTDQVTQNNPKLILFPAVTIYYP